MSDDVKVKFGADFTDVQKGATEAASKAGTAMKGWASDFTKTIGASFAGMFAADAVFGAIKDFAHGVREQLTYFRELQHVIEKTNVDAQEFQQLASYAKENGIAMESLGKGLSFANVYMGKLKDGSKAAKDELLALQFSQEEIDSGRLNSIDILKRLADAYQIEGQRAQVAEHMKKIFGKGGLELLPMLEHGSAGITEAMGGASTFSSFEIRAAANLDKVFRRMEKKKTDLQRKVAIFASVSKFEDTANWAALSATERVREGQNYFGYSHLSAPSQTSEELQAYLSTKEGAKDYARKLKQEYKKAGLDEDVALIFAQKQYDESLKEIEDSRKSGLTVSPESEAGLERLKGIIDALSGPEKGPGIKIGAAAEESGYGFAAMAASSLQQIGGGDIASVLAGTSPMDEVAENTRQMTIYLKTISETTPPSEVDETAAH